MRRRVSGATIKNCVRRIRQPRGLGGMCR
jgi:hypothetical protein